MKTVVTRLVVHEFLQISNPFTLCRETVRRELRSTFGFLLDLLVSLFSRSVSYFF